MKIVNITESLPQQLKLVHKDDLVYMLENYRKEKEYINKRIDLIIALLSEMG